MKNVSLRLKKEDKNKEGSSVKYEGLAEDQSSDGHVDFGSISVQSKKDSTFTVDEAVNALGFGKFQIKLSLLTGLAWMSDSMEMMVLSILSPALQCDWWISSYQQAMITTIVFGGMMLSSSIWGTISDKYGRKTSLILSSLMTFAFGLLSSLAPTFNWLLFLRGLTGFGIGGIPQAVTLYSEYLPTSHRAKCILLIESFWALGAAFEAVLALLVMRTLGWRWLLALSSLPLLLFCLCCMWLPESARYHLVCGQPDLAYETLMRVAIENKKSMPEGKVVDNGSIGDHERGQIVDLFLPDLQRTTILLWIIWMADSFCYYGIVLLTTELFQSSDQCHGGSGVHDQVGCALECHRLTIRDYQDLLWTTLAEFPAMVLTVFVIEYLGRKQTMALEFGIFSIFTCVLFFCLNRQAVTALIFIGRGAIVGSFQTAYVYTPEVYPTTLRAVGLGAANGMSRLGAIMTPFVAQVLFHVSVSLTISIYSVTGLLAIVACFLLPIETTGRQLMETHK